MSMIFKGNFSLMKIKAPGVQSAKAMFLQSVFGN
jgi:hypothetical protein